MGCFIYEKLPKLNLHFLRNGRFNGSTRCATNKCPGRFTSSCFSTSVGHPGPWEMDQWTGTSLLWHRICTESFLFDKKILQYAIKVKNHLRDQNEMFLILIKLSIHMARIGLLYSIDDRDPTYLLESIGRVEPAHFHRPSIPGLPTSRPSS